MSFSGFLVQLLNGLAGASSLFMVAAGLSLIFGVTRIVNFAHGSFFMLGEYIAYTLVEKLGASLGFWPALGLALHPAPCACPYLAGQGLVGIQSAQLRVLLPAPPPAHCWGDRW